MLVGHPGQVELEREALLHPVTRVHLLHVDEVQRLLGRTDHAGVLRRDVTRDPQGGLVEVGARHHLMHRPEMVQGRGVDGGGGEEQTPHHVLRHQPRQVGGRAEGAALHLGQPERRVVGGDDDVGVADQADAAAHAEAVDRGDDRHRALVHRAERLEAAAVGVDQCGEALGVLHFLDVHAGVEPAALGAQDHHVGGLVAARGRDGVGEFEPSAGRDRVDGRVVDGDRDDARLDRLGGDRHQWLLGTSGVGYLSKHLLGTLAQ